MRDATSPSAYLSNGKELGRVSQLPVAKFVGQDGNHLLGRALLDEGVVDDNVLLPRHAKEVRIAVGAARAAVDDKEGVERELEPPSQSLDARLQLSWLQRR